MKKIAIIFIMLLFSVVLSSCSRSYEPVASTDEEAAVVFTLTCDNEVYEVRYELYRALFLSHKAELDGGDSTLWSGVGAKELIGEMNELIVSYASRIYGAIHHAKKLGIDPYSKEFDDRVEEYIKIGVEGDGGNYAGAGSYEKYLDELKKMNLNYSVQDLLIRYSFALEKISEHYIGTEDEALGLVGGSIDVSEEKVREFYESDECVRVIQIYLQAVAYSESRAEAIRNEIAVQSSATDVANYAIQYTTSSYVDIFDGTVIGRNTVNEEYMEFTEAAFALKPGDTSAVIRINDGDEDGYYILYGLEKTESYFKDHFDAVKEAYLYHMVAAPYAETRAALAESMSISVGYYQIDHGKISMD